MFVQISLDPTVVGFHYLKNTNLCILIDAIYGHHTISIEGELLPFFILQSSFKQHGEE